MASTYEDPRMIEMERRLHELTIQNEELTRKKNAEEFQIMASTYEDPRMIEMERRLHELTIQNEELTRKKNAEEILAERASIIQECVDNIRNFPNELEKLRASISSLVNDCESMAKDLEDLSTDMQSSANRNSLVQSITSGVSIVGCTVVFVVGTGSVSLPFSIISFASTVYGFKQSKEHYNEFKNLVEKTDKCSKKGDTKFKEFERLFVALKNMRADFVSSELFTSDEFKIFRKNAEQMRDVMDGIITEGSCQGFEENFILKVLAMRNRGAKIEETMQYILRGVRNRACEKISNELLYKACMQGSEYVIENCNDLGTMFAGIRTAVSGVGCAVNGLIYIQSGHDIEDVATQLPNLTSAFEQVYGITTKCGAQIVEFTAFSSTILEIVNLVAIICTYKQESRASKEVAALAKKLKEQVASLVEFQASIENRCKLFRDALQKLE